MRRLERPRRMKRRVSFAHFWVPCLAAALVSWVGCKPAGPETPSDAEANLQVTGQPAAPEGQPAPSAGPAIPLGDQPAAREVLDAMVAAYKEASSYDDKGRIEIRYQFGGQLLGDNTNFTVAFTRPNKIRVQAYGGMVVSDGEKLYAAVMNVSDQVLQRDAPAEINIESLYPNHNLADAMAMGPTQSLSWLPVQLILLFANDPLKTLLHASEEPELLGPSKIQEHDCHRVQVRREEGMGVFWIDQETHVLRRLEFPADALRAMIAENHRVPPDQVQDVSLVAEFDGAQFGDQIDPAAFQFQVPPEMKLVDDFMPGDLQWLGQPVPEFSFVDLDGNPVTRESLAGKIAVLDFWATWCNPCRVTLPDLEEVYQKYKDGGQIVFVAVSEDEPSVDDQKLRDTFQEIGVNVPIARDPEQHAHTKLGVDAYPTSLILGPKGIVQFRQSGGDRPGTGAALLSARLDKLLAGEDIFQERLAAYQQATQMQKKQFEGMFQKCLKNDLYVLTRPEIPRADILPRAEPKSLKLTELWSCTELAAPGNVLVVDRAEQPPRILVLAEGNSVAEIGPEGNVVSVKPLGVPSQEPVFFLRTAAGADERRHFVGSAIGVQQVHLWDDEFNLLVNFPEDAPQNPHAGIADVRIADLDGDGVLELALSYFGVVGVQGVSLDGTRTWANKSVIQSMRLAVLGPDAEGKRSLLSMNSQEAGPGTLVVLDPQGQRKGEFSVANRSMAWIEADDLDGDGRPEICGLTPVEAGNVEAVGLSLEGEELWSYPLPRGVHEYQIEAVTSAALLPDQPGQWLLAAADGTIHILDAQGSLIDVFAYGKTLTGVAAAEWDGKRVLLVSTTEGVDAWQVEPPATQ